MNTQTITPTKATPIEQTRALYSAFWGDNYTDAPELFTTLPTRRYDMMKQEIKELNASGMGKLAKGEKVGRRK